MKDFESASQPELRHQLEIAQMLAKCHVGFVVMPAKTRGGFEMLARAQSARLKEIAQLAEAGEASP